MSEVVVTASTLDLLGVASTASQGAVTKQELELRPVYRVGQLLETVPGLVVTVHSGEGKANQYLLRGFNLDHGTDLATFVDGMPVNERTHAHGQGYTDLNFLIPELASGIRFTKGPYDAAEGDFSSVGAVRMGLVDTLPVQAAASVGTVGDQRLFAGGTVPLASDARLTMAGEAVHLDGPWDHPDDLRKVNAALRLSQGDAADGAALTALYYRGLWNATTDQPERAVAEGRLISRFGTLDPSDGGQAERFSLSGTLDRQLGAARLGVSAYAIRSQLTLWNDFTHFLDDPVNGDQHAQNDRRTTLGGQAQAGFTHAVLGVAAETTLGVQGRWDDIYVDARHTLRRVDLETLLADRVREGNLSAFAETTLRWSDWARTVTGLRLDHFAAQDENLVGGLSGARQASVLQPKASLILGPWNRTELYVSAGGGFHSNDVRAGTLSDVGVVARPPFLVKSTGYEVGLRTSAIPHVQAAVTAFEMSFASELTYNADAGQTEAGRPGRRRGVEVTAQYRPFRWIELNANLALSRARYTDGDPAGPYIEDAPSLVASAGMLVDNLGPWFGALEFRDLGEHALTPDNRVRSAGYRELNLNLGYRITPKLKVQLDVFNVTNSKDDAAAYFYTDRLPGEPAGGVEDVHRHPLEPISARLAVSAVF
ncbi:TonB-dependent receptor [Phenylobacterium hankyongense]|uniref:TonB-dependent receptor n=1 Tax=Phenylobacterium hankyongense TaxID=1813876 RepID=A0A328B2Y7_9CAUL|nr:TonB-dependent receptor [Phenylobacterium hankyongense]